MPAPWWWRALKNLPLDGLRWIMPANHIASIRGSRGGWPATWNAPQGFIMSLLSHYGMNEEERRRRQSFLGITDQDAENVRSLRTHFAEYAREFAEGFYQHLLSHPHTASLLQDPKQLER